MKEKRLVDILILLLGSVFLFIPMMAISALLIWINLGQPVFFRQLRPGLMGNPFTLYKFRTMTEEYDAHGKLLSDGKRLTSLGKLMRRLSLDELPTFYNVLMGDMSLVGPRPLLMEYLDRYSPEQARRHEVKPGITGWAQVNGRNAITWEEKFRYDVWYVDNWSIALDLRIVWMTLLRVIRREGINQPGHATMPAFRGSESEQQSSYESSFSTSISKESTCR